MTAALAYPAALAALFAAVLLPPAALAASPHTSTATETASCSSCHQLHVADGDSLLNKKTQLELCFQCHSLTGGAADVRSGLYASTTKSSHPIVSDPAPMMCTTCHTPHQGPAEGNPASLAVGSMEATSGVAVCAACHGPGSALPGGDMVSGLANHEHSTIRPPESAGQTPCLGCHAAHSSSNAYLVRPQVRVGEATITVGTGADLCRACHAVAGGIVASRAKHATVTTSTVALVQADGEAGDCGGCHDPHGKDTSTSGDLLCLQCHVAPEPVTPGIVYPVGYSYRGPDGYALTSHAALLAGRSYQTLSAESPGFGVWETTIAPSPASPGTEVTREGVAALVLADGDRLTTSLQSVDGGFDYQTYFFDVGLSLDASSTVRLQWAGYGEEATGYPVTVSVWDVSASQWEPVASGDMAAQQFVEAVLVPARHMDAQGGVWVRAQAQHREVAIPAPAVVLSTFSSPVDQVYSLSAGEVSLVPDTSGTGGSTEVLHRSLNTDYVGLVVGYPVGSLRGSCVVCHAMHGSSADGTLTVGQVATNEGRLCTGDGAAGCHGAGAAGGTDIAAQLTASADPRAHHDVMPEARRLGGDGTQCSECHNPHRDSAGSSYSDPDDIGVAGPTDQSTLCLRCHDGVRPGARPMPSGVATIAVTWVTDRHGQGTSATSSEVLDAPYARGNPPIPCAVCHVPHGSASVYHVPTTVNGRSLGPITNGVMTTLCASCHADTVLDMHIGCTTETACHGIAVRRERLMTALTVTNDECTDCHGHGRTWAHPDKGPNALRVYGTF